MNVEASTLRNKFDNGDYAIPFARYIFSAKIIDEHTFNVISTDADEDPRYGMRRLWTASGVSGHDLAAAAAEYFVLRKAALAELLSATSLADRFSRRFLRDVAIFPFAAADRRPALAMGDPMDREARKAAELVLGEGVEVVVASFEDIAAALGEQDGAAPAEVAGSAHEDSLDNLRDLASGAPVVRAVDELIDKAMELHASDIHVEPSRGGLVVRTRVDGLLRALNAPLGVPPQALISRIKIMSGLNIAERRLPQDGSARLRTARGDLDIRVATMPTPARQIRGHSPAAARPRAARYQAARHGGARRKTGPPSARPAARPRHHHRSDRQRQDDDAGDAAVAAQSRRSARS